MGKTLAQGAGLTTRQKKFLAVVLQTPYVLERFYLTGGTALSCWYLHHRESLDLDFFTEKNEVNATWINRWLQKNQGALDYKTISHSEQFGFHFYSLAFDKGESLKIDFSYFPSNRIERGIIWKGLYIDSLYDIAVNKFQTITSFPRAKDYVDLYFILKENRWKVDKLRLEAAVKHGIRSNITLIAKNFLRVVEFEDYPKMLVPFDQTEMVEFFLQLAKSLEKEIFKN